jgi:GNAT superfamily N-acetyltransferase
MPDSSRVTIRPFRPGTDRPDDLARLNPFPPAAQAVLAREYAKGFFAPENVIVAEADGRLVGILHIFDAGLPWVHVDGWYLEPDYRTFSTARAMGRFMEDELRRRGVVAYATTAEPRLARALERGGMTRLNEPMVLLGRRLGE